ncbi:hypothetical protein M378DRAFT_162044 [Amanita muscaria Koide BX008]|uniref:DUF7598 domain-containing protein n=1 Tax=Amanita muscaria (strain Koide BX008) TaxID=946122 RepID=A0A0C2SQ76_AMAMK|nr:hypothetical protein M378DRAFT_162044 [Amanita muscaria Koide BX008]
MLPPRGYVFIALNVVRIISVVSLVLVFASNIDTLVHDILAVNKYLTGGNGSDSATSTTISQVAVSYDYIMDSTVPIQPGGAFWAVLNRLLIMGQTIVLLLSESGWPSVFFERFFPILGKEFGLGALGLMQCLIGAATLSHHVDDFTLVSAIFLFSIGCLYIILGFIFGPSARAKRSVTSWRDQTEPSLPSYTPQSMTPLIFGSSPSFGSSPMLGSDKLTGSPGKSAMGFGRQADKIANAKGYLISKPLDSLPRYAPRVPVPRGMEQSA